MCRTSCCHNDAAMMPLPLLWYRRCSCYDASTMMPLPLWCLRRCYDVDTAVAAAAWRRCDAAVSTTAAAAMMLSLLWCCYRYSAAAAACRRCDAAVILPPLPLLLILSVAVAVVAMLPLLVPLPCWYRHLHHCHDTAADVISIIHHCYLCHEWGCRDLCRCRDTAVAAVAIVAMIPSVINIFCSKRASLYFFRQSHKWSSEREPIYFLITVAKSNRSVRDLLLLLVIKNEAISLAYFVRKT